MHMSDSVSIDIELTEEDERRALIVTLTRHPLGRFARALYYVVAVAAFGSVIAAGVLQEKRLILVMAALVGVTLLVPYLLHRASRESWALRSRKKIRYSFSSTHFRVEKGERATSVPWRLVDQIAETTDLLVIYVAKEVHPVPLRHLGERTRTLIHTHVASP